MCWRPPLSWSPSASSRAYTCGSRAKKAGDRKDERTERCSLLASRNAFLAGILLTTFLAVLVQLGVKLDFLDSLRTIWSLGMTAYLLSYLVYKRAV